MLFDLHVHTDISPCSRLSLEDTVNIARSRGLDGICITDHDTMAVSGLMREGVQPNGLVVLFGMEYATPDGDLLLFGPYESLAPGLSAREVLDLVEHTRGAAVAAHPRRPGRSASDWIFREYPKVLVECLNGRTPRAANHKARAIAERHSLATVGGSDAHTPQELGRVGTLFTDPILSRDHLIDALRRGDCIPRLLDRSPQAFPASTYPAPADHRHRL